MSLLLQPESQVRSVSDALREQARSDIRAAEALPLIPTIVLARFSDRPVSEICEMVGITLDNVKQSRAYQEIFGLGEARGNALGEARGKALGEAAMTLRLLARRCYPLATVAIRRRTICSPTTGDFPMQNPHIPDPSWLWCQRTRRGSAPDLLEYQYVKEHVVPPTQPRQEPQSLCPPRVTPVILCGGTGTRLWPLSRATYPKQYWPLAGSGEETLLQQ
ncbi:MAG: sugar phosphate nucleotidyltransferase, partial [Synechococcus sp. ELA057]